MVATTAAQPEKARQEALERILREIMATDKTLDGKVRAITEIACVALGVERCSIVQGRPLSNMNRILDAWDARSGQHRMFPDFTVTNTLYREAMGRDQFVATEDVLTSPLEAERAEMLSSRGIRAILVAAAWRHDRSLGGISFAFGEPHRWSEDEITFAKSAANLVALLLALDRGDTILARLDQVPVAIHVEDESGAITYTNQAARDLADRHCAGDLGNLPRPKATLTREADIEEISFAGRELEINRTRMADGSVMARISDVTERKAELARINALLRSIVDSTDDMIWCVDPVNLHLTMFNRGLGDYYEKQRGYSLRIGMNQEELMPDERARRVWREMYRRTLALGSFSTEYDVIADKRTLLLHINRMESGGKICGFSVFGQDITEIKNIQDRLVRAQKMEAMGRTAAGVAHDFNNVLGAIGGFASLLAHDVVPASPQHDFVARIQKCCQKGKDIVDQVLTFARSSEVVRSPLDLDQLVQQCQEFKLDPLFAAVEFSIAASSGSLPVLGNQTQIGQLISNLCMNARDARRGDSIEIAISAATAPPEEMRQLEQAHAKPDQALIGVILPGRSYCRLRIADNGTGIKPDLLPRIFEPFFTTKGRQHGTGLGLAVVHGVVQSHHAVCHVRSVVGEGTAFSIYFPCETAIAASAERLLVVDDDQDILDILTIGLGRLGFKVTAMGDPLQALAAFSEDPTAFDAVISDNVMPSMAGKELLRRLKEVAPSIITVLCSGSAFNESASQGADLFFSKSTGLEQIAAAIRSQAH